MKKIGNLLGSPVGTPHSPRVSCLSCYSSLHWLWCNFCWSYSSKVKKGRSQSKNGKVCPHAWVLLISPTDQSESLPLWSQHILEVLRCPLALVWLPPRWTNPTELVLSATTSWPGGIWPLKRLQKECLSRPQRTFLLFRKVKVAHRVSYCSPNSVWSPGFILIVLIKHSEGLN